MQPASALRLVEDEAITIVEAPSGQPLMATPNDANLVIEACLSHGTDKALVYASNLTPAFFDLSSREAGEILQKLRNYGVRLAVVCPPGEVQFSSRFGEMVAEEQRKRYFALCDSRADALRWLGEA